MQKARETLEARGYSCKYDRQYKCLVFEHDLHTVRFFSKERMVCREERAGWKGIQKLT